MNSKRWLILFAALVVFAGFSQVLMHTFFRPAAMASVYQNGNLIQVIDLGRVTAPDTITVTGIWGRENVILVEPGRISVLSATCRDQICVNQGSISNGVRPIVCLPHRVVIQIDPAPDGFIGTGR
ncbi:MAG: NusG domain II-containing protein [Oscillospiraceae bacterium]|nr:NusG domain II-containing protein [Oscillospiraceae bacterium]